jgi:hypothetical protein
VETVNLSRRGLLAGIIAAAAAPVIVRAGLIMPIKPKLVVDWREVHWASLKQWARKIEVEMLGDAYVAVLHPEIEAEMIDFGNAIGVAARWPDGRRHGVYATKKAFVEDNERLAKRVAWRFLDYDNIINPLKEG